MNITSLKEILIFRNEYNGKVFYSAGLSKRDKDGNYINGYIKVNFKKDVDIPDRTLIKIKKAWLDFYIKDKKTIPLVFISEYETANKEEKNPYEEFGKAIANPDKMPW